MTGAARDVPPTRGESHRSAPTAAPTAAAPRRETWRDALLNRRMLACVFIGFTAGLPLWVLLSLLPAWLRTEHVDLKSIGLFALIQLPYTWKFLWSPLMDRYALPLLGRRRGWMLATQLALLASIPLFGLLHPALDLWTIAYVAAAVAFFSASQDIVLDAYRREILPDAELGLGNAIYVNAYRIASFVPGALALILADHLPWLHVFAITALFMLPGVAMTLVVREPPLVHGRPRTLAEAIVDPFREFIARAGVPAAALILAFIFCYKLGDSMATSLATPFYIDMGFSLSQIGAIAKSVGITASLVGAMVGGLWMVRLGIDRALWTFGAVQVVSILGFAALAYAHRPDPWLLAVVIAFEALGAGLGTVAFTAFIARTTDPRDTATQFALFTSLFSIPRTVVNASTGWIVDQTGWFAFFLICTGLALPGMALLLRVAPWGRTEGRAGGEPAEVQRDRASRP